MNRRPTHVSLSNAQIAQASRAGIQLLNIDDLPVPMKLSKSGDLGILEGILHSLVKGECVVTNTPEPKAEEDPPESD